MQIKGQEACKIKRKKLLALLTNEGTVLNNKFMEIIYSTPMNSISFHCVISSVPILPMNLVE